jgi:hypothetical protein
MSESLSDSPAGLQAPKPPALDDPGPITRRFMQVNVARSNTRIHTLISDPALSHIDLFIFADPWWGPIGNAKNDDDPLRRIYGAPATREWNIFHPPINLKDSAPSTVVYVRKGRNIIAEVIPDAPATRFYFTMNITIGQFEFHLTPVYFHGKTHTQELRTFMAMPTTAHPTLICGDFNVQHAKLALYDGAKVTGTAIGNEFLAWIQDHDSAVYNDLREVTRISSSGESASILDYTIGNSFFDSYDVLSDWDISFPHSLGSDHGAITFTISASGPSYRHAETDSYIIDAANRDEWEDAYNSNMKETAHPPILNDEEKVENFAQAMLDAMRRATETTMDFHKSKNTAPPRAPWWNEDCTHACADLVHARKVGNSLAECKTLATHLWFCIRSAKKRFFEQVCAEATPDNIWNINQWYRGRKTYTLPTLRRPDGSLATTAEHKAELLHRTFFPPAPQPPPAHSGRAMPQRPKFDMPVITEH